MFTKDNRGASFVAVLVCVLFIGILASIVLGVVHSNLTNNTTRSRSTVNFYEGEEAVDELQNNLKQRAATAMTKAYEEWLRTYSTVPDSEKDEAFGKLFSKCFENEVADYFEIAGRDEPEEGYKDYKELFYQSSNDNNVSTSYSTKTPQ